MADRDLQLWAASRTGHWAVLAWIRAILGRGIPEHETVIVPAHRVNDPNTVLLMRDYPNALASIITRPGSDRRFVDLWVEWFKHHGRILSGGDHRMIVVKFLHWKHSPLYRAKLADCLGGSGRLDEGERSVMTMESQSTSSHGRTYWNGDVSVDRSRDVDHEGRWLRVLEDKGVTVEQREMFLELVVDREALSLSEEIFTPPPRDFYRRVGLCRG